MRRQIGPIALGCMLAFAAHIAAVYFYPHLAVHAATRRILQGGASFNAWKAAKRATSDSRAVVRPSPDQAYSVCLFDLSRGPLRIHVAPWTLPWSLSLYAANSDNFAIVDDRDGHAAANLVVVANGQAPPSTDIAIVRSPSTTGIALIRRLAPTDADWNQLAPIRTGDLCRTEPAS